MNKKIFARYGGIGLLLVFVLSNALPGIGAQQLKIKVPDISIRLIEPQYIFFGISETGEIEISLDDVVKFHGHLCGGVAFGFRAAQVGLKELYGDKLPVRGEVRVYTSLDTCPADVLCFITGARTNFGGLHKRGDLILDPKAEKKYFRFVHKKTGKIVILELIFDPRAEIKVLKMKAKKDPKFLPQFQRAVKDIIPRILFNPAEKIFKITAIEQKDAAKREDGINLNSLKQEALAKE